MDSNRLAENLLSVLPLWHAVIDKTFKQSLKDRMSLESYCCLQLLRQGGAVTMSELARKLRISRQQATQTVERLYQYDLVRRRADAADRRCIQIEITPQAERYLDQIASLDAALLNRLDTRLGPEDVQALGGAVETLLRILPLLAQDG